MVEFLRDVVFCHYKTGHPISPPPSTPAHPPAAKLQAPLAFMLLMKSCVYPFFFPSLEI